MRSTPLQRRLRFREILSRYQCNAILVIIVMIVFVIALTITGFKAYEEMCTEEYVCPVTCIVERQVGVSRYELSNCSYLTNRSITLHYEGKPLYIGNREDVFVSKNNANCACPDAYTKLEHYGTSAYRYRHYNGIYALAIIGIIFVGGGFFIALSEMLMNGIYVPVS